MRKYAFVDPKDEVKKVMIYEVEQDIYVFTYQTLADVPCTKDYWFETLSEAEEYCENRFGRMKWIQIEDPRIGEPQDLINAPKLRFYTNLG